MNETDELKMMNDETSETKKNPRIFKPAERAEADASGEVPAIPFPSECLPKVLREMAEGVAKLERLPVAMSGPMVLGVASAALGRGVVLKGLRGKITPPNLFVCVCKESGTGGSTAFKSVTAPLDGMQARIHRWFRDDELPRLEADKITLTVEAENCKAKYKKAEIATDREQVREELRGILAKIKKAEEAMREPLLWTSDSTPEALAEKLAGNADTLAQLNPDAGDSFSSMLGCYRDKSSRDGSHALWLKAFSNESHTITRTRGTVHLRRPCLAMLLVITPSTARKHLEDKSLLETGFLGRLLLCDPKAEMSEGTFEEAMASPSLPSDVSQPFEAAIWKALAFYHRPRGLAFEASPFDEDDSGAETLPSEEEREPFVIECEEGALRVLHEDRQRQCRAWKAAESERELIARETEQAARLALVLHVFDSMTFRRSGQGGTWKVNSCKGHERPLTAETMRKAIIIRDWFKASLAAMTTGQREAARDESFSKLTKCAMLYDWHKTGITPRNLVSHRLASTSDTARKVLETWASEGKLTKRDREAKGTGRKPEPAFFLPSMERLKRAG